MIGGVSTAGGETGALTRVVVKHAREAFCDRGEVARDWRDLNFTAEPDVDRAFDESDAFFDVLRRAGADLVALPPDSVTTLDSIYVRDAALISPSGVVLCRMGKSQRDTEPEAQRRVYESIGVPVAGAITPPGTIEGGDVVWLDDHTVAVGRGYRTNDAGIQQFADILGPSVHVLVVPLVHWRGANDVFHLMSFISPVDRDLAVVYSPLMPVPFREALIARGISFVDVPDDEFDSMGANVLALGPRNCLMVAGNPRTQRRLETAGARVQTYEGREISLKGGGGPTCLTRPLIRSEVKGQRSEVGQKE